MAELGATVIAFLSLANAVSAAYDAYTQVREAPAEVQAVAGQLRGLVTITNELQHVPFARLSASLADHVDQIIAQITEDVAKCGKILELADADGSVSKASRCTRLHTIAKFAITQQGKKARKLAARLQIHRSSLALALQVMESASAPHQYNLLEETHANAQRLPQLIQVSTLGTHEFIQSTVATARAQLHGASLRQHRQLNEQLAMIRACMEDFKRPAPRRGASHISHLARHIRFRSAQRYDFTFPMGSVILSWGPLRKRTSSADAIDGNIKHGDQCSQWPPGFSARLEFVPSQKLSSRAIIAGFRLLRDQRGSPSIFPYLSCPVTIPHGADILTYAERGNTDGIKQLFGCRSASVSDRTVEGWTPLHIAAAAGQNDCCRLLLECDANVTTTGYIGITPLHLAAAYGNFDTIKLLMQYGADPCSYNQHGFNTIFEVLHSSNIPSVYQKSEIVKWILQQDYFTIDVNDKDYQENSLLMWFAEHCPDGVELPLRYGADVEMQGRDGITAFHLAAQSGKLEVVQHLLQNGADFTHTEIDGSTALVRAAEYGHSDIVRFLMSMKVDIQSQNDYIDIEKQSTETEQPPRPKPGQLDLINRMIESITSKKLRRKFEGTALLAAAQRGYWDVVSILREAGVDPYRKDEYGYRALVRLVYDQNLEKVNELVETGMVQGSKVDEDISMSLVRAAENGHFAVIDDLICSADLAIQSAASNSRALAAAARYGQYRIVQRLLDVVPAQYRYKALIRAGEYGHLDIVNLLLDSGTRPTRESPSGDTAIVRAARYGHADVVKRLLSAKADPNQYGWFGYTALVRASYNGHIQTVNLLLAAGADPNQAELEGDTAIIRAARFGYMEVVGALIHAGAQPVEEKRKDEGPTKALMKAAIYGNTETMRQLLDAGGDPNCMEVDGNTPLIRAAENGHLDVVNLLLDGGADLFPKRKKDDGVTPLSRAAEKGHIHVVKRLLQVDTSGKESHRRTALVRAAESGQIPVVNQLIEDGVDVRAFTSSTKAVGKAHYSMMSYWIKSASGSRRSSLDFGFPSEAYVGTKDNKRFPTNPDVQNPGNPSSPAPGTPIPSPAMHWLMAHWTYTSERLDFISQLLFSCLQNFIMLMFFMLRTTFVSGLLIILTFAVGFPILLLEGLIRRYEVLVNTGWLLNKRIWLFLLSLALLFSTLSYYMRKK